MSEAGVIAMSAVAVSWSNFYCSIASTYWYWREITAYLAVSQRGGYNSLLLISCSHTAMDISSL